MQQCQDGYVERVLNLYGPTEDTVYSTSYLAGRGEGRPPIGRPLPGTVAYVLDRFGRLVAPGMRGELHLAGAGVARGYVNRPRLTAERFVPDPFSGVPGARMYRTGDLVRFRADGVLDYLGRLDRQVKVRGLRIELEEIEHVLVEQPGVRHATVRVLRESSGDRLVAYLLVDAAGGFDESAVRRAAGQRLPGYMVPAAFVPLESLPLTGNGKLDVTALPVPPAVMALGRRAPATDTERRIARIWADVLHLDDLGADDDFFALGGHSLAALRVMSRVDVEFAAQLEIRDLLVAPTVARLAATLDSTAAPDKTFSADLSSVLPLAPGRDEVPVVLLHPIGGGLLGYADLVPALGRERPVLGLEAPRFDAADGHLDDLVELGRHHLASLDKEGLTDRCLLVGWSMGGTIGYEMARQLAASGRPVPPLVLLDSPSGSAGAAPDPVDAFVSWLEASGGADELVRATGAGSARQALNTVLNAPAGAGELGLLASRFAVFAANLRALSGYSPERVKVDVLCVVAGDEERTDNARMWQQLVANVQVVKVSGNHHSFLRGSGADRIAEVFSDWLRRLGRVNW